MSSPVLTSPTSVIPMEQFDGAAYLAANPDVAASGMNAYQHYTTYGINEGRSLGTPAVSLPQLQANQIQNPTLPTGAEFVPVTQKVQQNELQQAPTPLAANGLAVGTAQQVAAPQANAAVVDPNAPMVGYNPNAGQATANLTTAVAPMQAAQGTVNTNDTVQGQLANLTNFKPGDPLPAWAQGAANLANEASAARGMGSSTIGTTALFQAVQSAALPIAAADASTYFQMDVKNLDNQQQTNLQNTQMRQQNMLTDVAVQNATAQFNAANAQQSQQFVSTMISSIMDQNAARTTAVSQSNASNSLNASEFNVQQDTAIKQFNSQLASQREQFNSQMQFAIDQSNVTWRRSVNTANTAEVNAATQANVKNTYDISQVALNNVWQQWRDEASWAFTASENQANRDYNLTTAANNRNFITDTQQTSSNNALYAGVGSLVSQMIFK